MAETKLEATSKEELKPCTTVISNRKANILKVGLSPSKRKIFCLHHRKPFKNDEK